MRWTFFALMLLARSAAAMSVDEAYAIRTGAPCSTAARRSCPQTKRTAPCASSRSSIARSSRA